MTRRVVIAVNTAWNLFNFRAGLIRALITRGYEVVAVAPQDEYAERVAELGCRFISLPMDNKGTHPGRDLLLFIRFYRLLRQERPFVFLGYTVKPNIYGSLASHVLDIPVVNNIAGLGAVFIEDGWLTRVVRGLYRLALRRSARVFFQNEDDRQVFVEGGLVPAGVTDCVPGSGVDLDRFSLVPIPSITSADLDAGAVAVSSDEGSLTRSPAPGGSGEQLRGKGEKRRFRFLLIARMLWDKGVGEYVEAARHVRRHYPDAEFCLLGFLDVQNPAAISREQMQAWVDEGVVHYLGVTDDVRPPIAAADCVVLPSFYREGVPRTLLEAAAMGRPIITTDATGCREVVVHGVNGYLCQVRDAGDLAAKMEQMILLSPVARAEMGHHGRQKVEREFDESIVIRRYLQTIQKILEK